MRRQETDVMYGSHRWQGQEYLHNCPYCRCSKLTSHNLNLYLTKREQPVDCLPQMPFALTFPQRQGNIVFSYMSPPKMQRHRSQGRFSTKRFKDQHFPLIGKINEEEERLISLASQRKLPHQVAKTKPESGSSSGEGHNPSFKKPSPNSNSSSSPKVDASFSQPTKSPLSQDPKATPIQYLKLLPPNSPQMPKEAKTVEMSIENPIARQWPTSNSSNIKAEAVKVPHQIQQSKNSHSEINRQLFEQGSKRVGRARKSKEGEDMSLVSSIAEELHLHYDYYYPPQETDQSLSLGVDL